MAINQNVISLNSKSIFNLNEANELVTIIKKITDKHHENLNKLLEFIDNEKSPTLKDQLKKQAQAIVDSWNKKIIKLGAKPTGIWFADMDFGEGYYCWKYPEEKVTYWHKHDEGFTKRKCIVESH